MGVAALASMAMLGCSTTPPGHRGVGTNDVSRRITVYYATDRAVVSSTPGQIKYGTRRAYIDGPDPFELGVCRVEIRRERSHDKSGPLPRTGTELVRLMSTNALDRWSFYDRVRENMWNADATETLVFVHGFNNEFDDAIKRTAELWYDLDFDGPPILYSWPSKGGVTGYFADVQTVEWSAAHLKAFLLQLSEETTAARLMTRSPARIHLVAHSMGSRALMLALALIADDLQTRAAPIFCDVILAAPDIDRDVLRDVILPDLLHAGVAEHYTLYASAEDVALRASQTLQYYPRAGSTAFGLFDEDRDDFDLIDTSEILRRSAGMKHDYFVSQPEVIRDLIQILVNGDRNPASPRRHMMRQDAGEHGSRWILAGVDPSG